MDAQTEETSICDEMRGLCPIWGRCPNKSEVAFFVLRLAEKKDFPENETPFEPMALWVQLVQWVFL
jgi:hypothetical protein